jgi:hypothetical protein
MTQRMKWRLAVWTAALGAFCLLGGCLELWNARGG